ncbi:MAG: hypothetical protein ACOYXT_11125 [Bacteroidota bacterium]
MELTFTPTHLSRDKAYPVYQDYAALKQIGYDAIARYSGRVWTNYNDSDPGVTILQQLCYALTELGHKVEIPMRDLLTGRHGRIEYFNHFHRPVEAFPVNPVTCSDYARMVVDAIPEIKQAYISSDVPCLPSLLSVALELRPEMANDIRQDAGYGNSLKKKADQLLRRHATVSQCFSPAAILSSRLLNIYGTITIQSGVIVEEAIARILFSVNQALSPYPAYQSYEQATASGKSLADVLDGPLLSRGILLPSRMCSKRTSINVHEVAAAIMGFSGVLQCQCTGLSLDIAPGTTSLSIDRDEVLYAAVESLKQVILCQNGNVIKTYNADKVRYYYDPLVPVPVPIDWDSLLPVGEFKKINQYNSIQNEFPAVYQLSGKPSGDVVRQAQVKQLKAYLALYEQLMADFLSQLGDLPSAFSFSSGRTDTRLTAPTYYNQPIYQVPGIDKVLEGVSEYNASGVSAWKAYREDDDNPYNRKLKMYVQADPANLDRKLRALEHLLARGGKQYDHQPLPLTNPRYGDDAVAEIEYIERSLKQFSELTADRARTYFNSQPAQPLISGVVRNVELELGLCSFYQGVIEACEGGLNTEQGIVMILQANGTAQVVYGEHFSEEMYIPGYDNHVLVYWQGQPMLILTPPQPVPLQKLTHDQAVTLMQPYVDLLKQLMKLDGFPLLDGARLAEFLRYQWMLKNGGGQVVFTSELVTLRVLHLQLAAVYDPVSLTIRQLRSGKFEVGLATHIEWYAVCADLSTEQQAKDLCAQLNNLKQNTAGVSLQVNISNTNQATVEAAENLRRVVSFFPDWIYLFRQNEYQQMLIRKMEACTPAAACSQLWLLSLTEIQELLVDYETWMDGLQNQYDGKTVMPPARQSAEKLIKWITNS